jgi:hypothetical protein
MRRVGVRFLSLETVLTVCGDRGSRKCVEALPESRKNVPATRRSAQPSGGRGIAVQRLTRFPLRQEYRVELTCKEVRRLFQVPARGRVRSSDYDPGCAASKQFKELTEARNDVLAGE